MDEVERDEEELLIEQIEFEMRKIHASVEKLHNNQSLTESNDSLEKCLISNYCYSSCLLQRGIDDEIYKHEDVLKRFKNSLEQELDFLSHDLNRIIKKMNEYNDMFSSIDTNISNLSLMVESSQKETSSDQNMNVTTKHIKMRFKKEKSDLKAIITNLFADNLDIQDLIAKIIEHHFNEGCDKYLELEYEDNITEQIELLRRTNLFDINPHDPLQIRLADLV